LITLPAWASPAASGNTTTRAREGSTLRSARRAGPVTALRVSRPARGPDLGLLAGRQGQLCRRPWGRWPVARADRAFLVLTRAPALLTSSAEGATRFVDA